MLIKGQYFQLQNNFGVIVFSIHTNVARKRWTLLDSSKELLQLFTHYLSECYLLYAIQNLKKRKTNIEGALRFELRTSRSAVECSTTELYPHACYVINLPKASCAADLKDYFELLPFYLDLTY